MRLDRQRNYNSLADRETDTKASEAFHRKAYQVGKALREQGEQMEQRHFGNLEQWIYKPIYPEEKFFKKIESALGFKLFVWQKTFILTGKFRQYGATTAEILRELLDMKAEPLDYTKPPTNNRERFYRNELRDIQGKLQRAGIETRAVFWSDKEKNAGKDAE